MVALAVLLELIWLGELSSQLQTQLSQSLGPLNVLKVQLLVDLPVADSAEVEWVSIGLVKTHCAHHEALVVNAVAEAEHVAKFVGSDLAESHQDGILKFFVRVE